jgi:hypothetical protein
MQYHTDSMGPDANAFRNAFAKAITTALKSDVNQMILLVHTLKMLKGGVCEEVLGERFVTTLAKNKVVSVQGVKVHVETDRVRSAAGAAVVFAPFVSGKLLSEAITDHRTRDLIYVPWAEQERTDYLCQYPKSVVI